MTPKDFITVKFQEFDRPENFYKHDIGFRIEQVVSYTCTRPSDNTYNECRASLMFLNGKTEEYTGKAAFYVAATMLRYINKKNRA